MMNLHVRTQTKPWHTKNSNLRQKPSVTSKLQTLYRLHLPIIRAVEIPLRSPDMGVPHQCLDRFKVVPVIQESSGKRVPHDMGMNPFLDQCLFYHGLNETVNTFSGQAPFLVRAMLPQRLEEGMSRICSVFGSLMVVLDGEEGAGVQGDAPEFLPFPDNVKDSLVPVGLEIPDFEIADFGLSQAGGKKGKQNGIITFALEGPPVWDPENSFSFFMGPTSFRS